MVISQNRTVSSQETNSKECPGLIRTVCFLPSARTQCNLTDSVHQLIGELNVSVSLAQFPALAAGSILYLTAPGTTCHAVKEGKWSQETERFLHVVAHGHEHQHRREADPVGHRQGVRRAREADHHHDHEHGAEDDDHHHHHGGEHEEHSHNHDHIDAHGLNVLLEMLYDHYDPENTEVSEMLSQTK